ncbi:MAG TPA: RES family NAD+ phosphorylase [Xanthobacteraceae bacterium]|jgi:RES domain-containing protein
MRLWRISNYADLSGEGARRAEGRWHERGQRVVYLAEHPALALLEVLVHLEIDTNDLPANYQLLEVETEDVPVEEAPREELDRGAPGWERDSSISRRYAKQWLAEQQAALLRIPSIVLPRAWNFLLNPTHPDAGRIRIVSAARAEYDRRLFSGARMP